MDRERLLIKCIVKLVMIIILRKVEKKKICQTKYLNTFELYRLTISLSKRKRLCEKKKKAEINSWYRWKGLDQ